MALVNRKLNPELVTIFLMPGENYTYINSSIVKEVAQLGGRIEDFVPESIAEKVRKKMSV